MKFDGPPFESSRTFQESEELQSSSVVMLGSQDPEKIIELGQIKVSSHDSPLSTVSPYESSFLKDTNLSYVSLRKYFHILLATMHYSLYYDLFFESSAPTTILNHSNPCLSSANCDQVQFDVILHLEEENNDNLVYISSD